MGKESDGLMAKLYQLVLVEHIHEFEENGWKLRDNRVYVTIGGWASVYMWKDEE